MKNVVVMVANHVVAISGRSFLNASKTKDSEQQWNCTALKCTALYCTVLHRTVLKCITLHCTVLKCIAL